MADQNFFCENTFEPYIMSRKKKDIHKPSLRLMYQFLWAIPSTPWSSKHLLNVEILSWWEICFQEKVNEKPIMYNIWLLTKRWTRTITVANIILEVTTTYNTAWLLIKCKSAKFGQEHLSPPCIFAYSTYDYFWKLLKVYSSRWIIGKGDRVCYVRRRKS